MGFRRFSQEMEKPAAALSFDADDLWTYLRSHGRTEWISRPTFWPAAIPRLLDLTASRSIRLTVFVVGQDAARPVHRALVERMLNAGHEIGNHSDAHDLRSNRETIVKDLEAAERSIASVTGKNPCGFRGPSYVWTPELCEILADRGYLYDSSIWPTWIGPFLKFYLRSRGLLRRTVEADFGRWTEALRPLAPHSLALAGGKRILEIPVTTHPVLRLPLHMTYLLSLGAISTEGMLRYLENALALCRRRKIGFCFLLHAPDLLDSTDLPGLEFLPHRGLSLHRKLDLINRVLEAVAACFRLMPLEAYAREVSSPAVSARPSPLLLDRSSPSLGEHP
jgi:hypothetical protein